MKIITFAKPETIGKPSLLAHDVFATVAFDAFLWELSSLKNDDKAGTRWQQILRTETTNKIQINLYD